MGKQQLLHLHLAPAPSAHGVMMRSVIDRRLGENWVVAAILFKSRPLSDMIEHHQIN